MKKMLLLTLNKILLLTIMHHLEATTAASLRRQLLSE
jgi:hypothetical protein